MKLPEMNRRNQVLLLLALIIVAIPSILIFDYTQNNPNFCTTCHIMDEAFVTWETSTHGDINCHYCHEPDMITNIRNVYDVITKNPTVVTKHAEIENELCEKCHTSNDPQWRQVLNTAGHQSHVFGENKEVYCIECHGMELHDFVPGKEACLDCHTPDNLHGTDTMIIECVACHDFLAEENELTPEKEDCLTCHSNKEIILSMPSEAHLETCLNCHDPHGDEISEDCSSCHMEVEGVLHDIGLHTDCTSCHVPHEAVEVRDSCELCHVDKIDHYAPVSCTNCHG